MQNVRESWNEIMLEPLKSCSPSDKLIWWHMRIHGEGKYSGKNLAASLGFAVKTVRDALQTLEDNELIVRVGRRSGPIPQVYRARSPHELMGLGGEQPIAEAAD